VRTLSDSPPARADADQPYVIALDWHNTTNGGRSTPPESSVVAVKKFIAAGWTPFVSSFVSKNSHDKRRELVESVSSFAERCGLSPVPGARPSTTRLFLHISDSPMGRRGKAAAAANHVALILVDDRIDILKDAEARGVLGLHCKPLREQRSGNTGHLAYDTQQGFLSFNNLEGVERWVTSEDKAGRLRDRLLACFNARTYGRKSASSNVCS